MIDRDVAIKVLPTEPGTEPGYRQQCHRAALNADRVAEPRIIANSGTADIDGQPYPVTPIRDGIDVHGLPQRGGPTKPHRAVHVIEQLAAKRDSARPQRSSKNSPRRPPKPYL